MHRLFFGLLLLASVQTAVQAAETNRVNATASVTIVAAEKIEVRNDATAERSETRRKVERQRRERGGIVLVEFF